jgi:hypothetical protein
MQGCSAKTGAGVWEGIKQLSETITKVENDSAVARHSIVEKSKVNE